jgi:predicted phage-related endonuclease
MSPSKKRNGPASVFAEKFGPSDLTDVDLGTDEDSDDDFACLVGHAVEPVLLRALAREHRCDILRGFSIPHREHAWMMSTPDGVRRQSDTYELVAECKVVGRRMMRHWGDETDAVPAYVHLQCQWQMVTTGARRAVVAAALGGTDLRFYELLHDDALAGIVTEAAERFYRDHMLTRRPPIDDDNARNVIDAVQAAWPKPARSLIASTPEIEALAAAYEKARDEEKACKEEKDRALASLCAHVGDAEGITGAGWRFFWRYREPSTIETYTRAGYRHPDFRRTKKGA